MGSGGETLRLIDQWSGNNADLGGRRWAFKRSAFSPETVRLPIEDQDLVGFNPEGRVMRIPQLVSWHYFFTSCMPMEIGQRKTLANMRPNVRGNLDICGRELSHVF